MLPSRFSLKGDLMPRTLKRHGLLRLFGLALSLSIGLGTVTPLLSQTVSPTPNCAVPQALCADIQQLAQDDVADDIPRRTAHAIELFKEKHPDWKTDPAKAKLEISKTYDREYSQQEKAKKQDLKALWEKLTENGLLVPFIGVLVLAIVGWFRDAIGKAWTALVKKIDDWVYSRFAGTRLFENVALQRYREALVEHNQHLKIPFRVNQKPLEMGEIYVPLKVAGTSSSDQVDAYSAIARHRRLLIKGIPGSGKTMLLRHMAFSYGQGRLLGLEHRPVPVLIELHRLNDPELTEEKLIAEIVEAFKRNRFPKAERFVRHSLQHGKLMLLLDGLDEVNSRVRPMLGQRISDLLRSFDRHQRCRLIVTCRTAVYDNEFAHETDQTLEVVEFTDQQMRRFLAAWQREIPAGKSIDQLMQTLRDRPRIMALARNPLLLTIIVHLYTDPAFELPRSRTEFYQVSTRILLEQWQDQLNRYRGGDKRRVLQHLALHQQQASTQQQQDRRSIDYPVVLEQIRLLLPSLNLDPDGDTIPLLEELVERSGLFLKIDGGDRYQFAHLTLQEYFAAESLADKPQDLIRLFQSDPTTWREVVKLWCGLAGDSTELIRAVYQQDAILGFECLADAQQVEQQQADSIIAYCQGLVGAPDHQDELTTAFGAVAASNRPRGKAVFQFLVEMLKTSGQPPEQTFAANALSLTNSPAAAQGLASEYFRLPGQAGQVLGRSEIRQPLIRMGDLAVPHLQEPALTNSISVLDDLHAIGTPDAAAAMVTAIWLDNSEKRQFWGRAAIHLASLLPRPEIEERLREHTLAAEQRTLARLDWVWQPFNEPNESALPVIAGRIAYLLSRINFSAMPEHLPWLDPRLVIPVCGIEIFSQAPTPKKWPVAQVEELLTATDSTPQIERQCLQILEAALGSDHNASSLWQILFSGLPRRLQLELLQLQVKNLQKPNPNHWINIFQSVQYEFKTSRHYQGVLVIAALLSLLATWGIWQTASAYPVGAVTGVLGFAVVVIGVFWLTLAQGIEESWEPSLFITFGIFGLRTYSVELQQQFQNRLVWLGVKVIYESLSSKIAFVFALGFVFALVFVFSGVSFVSDTFSGVFFIAAISGAFAGAIAVTGEYAVLLAVPRAFVREFAAGITILIIIIFLVSARAGIAFAADTFAGVVAAYSVSVLAGLGIGSWYYLTDESEKQWPKFFVVLALPWFCTAPIVLCFAGVGIAALVTPLTFLPLLPWQSAGLLELLLVGGSSWVWWWGQRREAMARNPLQGGLIEKTLRAQYGRPRR